jgi:hypothetical protein
MHMQKMADSFSPCKRPLPEFQNISSIATPEGKAKVRGIVTLPKLTFTNFVVKTFFTQNHA